MPDLTPVLQPTERDESLPDKLALIERVTLVAAIVFFALNLAGRLLVLLGLRFNGVGHLMTAEAAAAALVSALSLHLSGPVFSRRVHRLAVVLAAAVTLVCSLIACGYLFHFWFGIKGFSPDSGMRLETAAVFALLGAVLLLARAEVRSAVAAADQSKD